MILFGIMLIFRWVALLQESGIILKYIIVKLYSGSMFQVLIKPFQMILYNTMSTTNLMQKNSFTI